MAIGTPNPDFDAEPWCTDAPAEPEVIMVQETTEPMRPDILEPGK